MGSVGVLEEDEKIQLLQEKLKELELEPDILHSLLGISESDMVTAFENGKHCNVIR